MSLKRQIAFNTAIQLAGKSLNTGIGLLIVALMTRSLGVEKFGWFVTASSFLQFIAVANDFGFTANTASMLSEEKFDKQKIYNTLFTWRFLTAFFFNGLSPILILFFPYPAPVKIAAAILSVSFFSTALNQVLVGYYQTKLKMHIQVIGEFLSRATMLVGIFAIAYKNYDGFLPMMAIVSTSSLIYTVFLWLKSQKIRFQIDWGISRALYYKTWPMAIEIIFNAVYLQGGRILLPLFVSQSEVGLAGAAYRVTEIVIQVAAMVMGIMLPLTARAWSQNLRDEFKLHYQRSFDLILMLLIPMAVGIITLATPIMKLIAGNEFVNSGKILALLGIAIVGTAFGNVFGYLALAINRQKNVIWIYLSDAILSAIAYAFLIPKYGAYGAAMVTVFSEIYAGLFLMITVNRFARFWPSFKTFFKISLASLTMGVSVYLLQPMNIVLSIAFGIIIYGVLALLLNIISKETIKEIISRPPKSNNPVAQP
ncbi:MAG: flippase [Patescibacteria group bacterium]|nr:flippase [Patescibacteria group bacterium]